ncbi:MAG: type II toxin-antitoxin system VapC family toxin [Devosiaceae bacterium]|nr:type II toxin-antitoxin system VapC family toxin [Devosiaceae bacterium]
MEKMARILLDTCTVIWTGTNRAISTSAADIIDECSDRNETLFVSPITAWELGILVSKGRFSFSMDIAIWFENYVGNEAAELLQLSSKTLLASSFLPGNPPNDPGDRIIIATARQHGLRIMTRDKKILNYADAGHVNAIAC